MEMKRGGEKKRRRLVSKARCVGARCEKRPCWRPVANRDAGKLEVDVVKLRRWVRRPIVQPSRRTHTRRREAEKEVDETMLIRRCIDSSRGRTRWVGAEGGGKLLVDTLSHEWPRPIHTWTTTAQSSLLASYRYHFSSGVVWQALQDDDSNGGEPDGDRSRLQAG